MTIAMLKNLFTGTVMTPVLKARGPANTPEAPTKTPLQSPAQAVIEP